MLFLVPTRTFKENTINIASILRLFFDIMVSHVVQNLYLEVNSIDSNYVLSRIVLQSAGNKGLREEESRNPEDTWRSSVNPLLEELDPISQVLSP